MVLHTFSMRKSCNGFRMEISGTILTISSKICLWFKAIAIFFCIFPWLYYIDYIDPCINTPVTGNRLFKGTAKLNVLISHKTFWNMRLKLFRIKNWAQLINSKVGIMILYAVIDPFKVEISLKNIFTGAWLSFHTGVGVGTKHRSWNRWEGYPPCSRHTHPTPC